MKNFLKELVSVVPSKRQLDWYDVGFYAFVHFGVNTFTEMEWGTGKESESIFNPTNLDCDQWVDAIKSAGMKGMILTAKHHDGFCLWPSRYTEHSVKNSPYKGDVVREAAEACKRGKIKFGFYLSPWDRNSEAYGTDEYNDYFCNQLTELLTQYGDIFCVWFDNACGEGPNGKKQEYDFARYFELIRKYQPNAAIFGGFGPDVRWCGNEAGVTRESEWAVVPMELCKYSEVQTPPCPMADMGDISSLKNTSNSIGNLDVIMFSKGLTFTPAEVDTSIRHGWFYRKDQQVKSLDELFDIYVRTIGGNCCLNLNIPPTKEGKFDENDVKLLHDLGKRIESAFQREIPVTVTENSSKDVIQKEYDILFKEPAKEINYIVLEEDLTKGQRIESFQIFIEAYGYKDFPIYQGRTVGNRKICRICDNSGEQNPLLFENSEDTIDRLGLRILSARGEVFLKSIKVY